MYRSNPTQMNVQFTARVSATLFPHRRFVPREFLGIDADVDEDESTASRRPSPPIPFVFVDNARYAILRVPRGANYIVRNVNLVCRAVSAREVVLPPSILRVHPWR